MSIADILCQKGHRVVAVQGSASIVTAVELLTDNRIGAMVVHDPLGRLIGIVSERDIIRGLRERGSAIVNLKVADLMTRDVLTCKPSDRIKDVMAVMSGRRIRHMPVLDDGRLVGIVSIGDVVKSRLEEREQEVTVLQDISRMRA